MQITATVHTVDRYSTVKQFYQCYWCTIDASQKMFHVSMKFDTFIFNTEIMFQIKDQSRKILVAMHPTHSNIDTVSTTYK